MPHDDLQAPPPPPDDQPVADHDTGPVATETPPRPAPKPAPPRSDLPQFHLLLHNDPVNTMDHVVRSIVRLTPLTLEVAIRRMLEAHHGGRALLLTTHLERAELYRDQFQSRKITTTIEPA